MKKLKKSEKEVLLVLKDIDGSYIESTFSDMKRVNDSYNRTLKKFTSKTFYSLLRQELIDGQFPKFHITSLGRESV